MKKVLVVGAAGAVGIHTVKYLLSEGKYEITILDLKNKNSFSRLKRFKKRLDKQNWGAKLRDVRDAQSEP